MCVCSVVSFLSHSFSFKHTHTHTHTKHYLSHTHKTLSLAHTRRSFLSLTSNKSPCMSFLFCLFSLNWLVASSEALKNVGPPRQQPPPPLPPCDPFLPWISLHSLRVLLTPSDRVVNCIFRLPASAASLSAVEENKNILLQKLLALAISLFRWTARNDCFVLRYLTKLGNQIFVSPSPFQS